MTNEIHASVHRLSRGHYLDVLPAFVSTRPEQSFDSRKRKGCSIRSSIDSVT